MNKKNNVISARVDDWSLAKIKDYKIDCTDFELSTSDVVMLLIEYADFCNKNAYEECVSFKDFCNSRSNNC